MTKKMAAVARTFLGRFSVSPPLWQSQVDNKYGLSSPAGPVPVWLSVSLPVCSLSVVYGCILESVAADVLQLSAAVMEVGFEISAAESEGATSLLVSTESSCMESVASCTALLSSETETQYSSVWLCFYTESN